MTTYPIFREDGTLHAFEVTSGWLTFRPLYAILRSVPGVTNVRRQLSNDDRITFSYDAAQFVVHQPYGDSSRYWIGPLDPANYRGNLEQIHEAFLLYRQPILRLWDNIWRQLNV
jgi:hypothetical protein